LIIRTQDITTEVFVCPSSNAEKDDFGGGGGAPAPGATAVNKTSFSNLRKNLSYGIANPYPRTAGSASEPTYKWDNTRTAEFALAADIGPGVGGGYDVTLPTTSSGAKEMAKANSRNHQGAGMNVLFGDGHVEFVQNPFCGVQRDHIYTNSPDAGTRTSQRAPVGVDAIPGWDGDSVLLPQW
jgi:prepilin-type processing-associated H-X9-DG protein